MRFLDKVSGALFVLVLAAMTACCMYAMWAVLTGQGHLVGFYPCP